jgi:nitrite reductase/ring-hydroxylating ferredoxin subunit/DMSO/TMAO reductase YedYZ heme-binding membrane subunit
MSVGYVAVQWNRHKRIYDRIVASGVAAFLVIFVGAGKLAFTGSEAVSDPILLMRAFGACAFVMLHIILCIGPLARLDRRFLPLLYNRRHLGVATFLVGLVHGILAVGFYHGFGRVNPFVSLLTSNTNYASLSAFPFQILGAAALVILFLMAATSHDFWLKNLSAATWKRLHMMVYPAYGLLVMHVTLGALQSQRSVWLAALLGLGVLTVVTLHLVTGLREVGRDRRGQKVAASDTERWIDVGGVDEIADGRAKTICLAGRERVAVFRYGGRISAITNVCAHQGGPLSEGKIVDGCVTCPWHGWQYRPQDGRSPPPFSERISTYRVRVEGRRILINPEALPPGAAVEPGRFEEIPRA